MSGYTKHVYEEDLQETKKQLVKYVDDIIPLLSEEYDFDEILNITKKDDGTYSIEYSVTHLLYVENAIGTYDSETGILSFSGKDDRGNDIKAEIENKGDHLEVTVTQSNYEDIIGTKQEFFQADE